jgi:hypothetical protein
MLCKGSYFNILGDVLGIGSHYSPVDAIVVETWLHVCSSGILTLSLRGRMNLLMVSQHLGGIHSGCALSGTAWLLLRAVNNFRHHSVNPDVILVVGTLTNVALIVSALSAFPWIRNTHHK